MTTPIDVCRLYIHLRDLAYPDHGRGPRPVPAGSGLVDLDHDFDGPNELGLSTEDIDEALDDLLHTELVHRLTPRQERARGLTHPSGHHDTLFVRALDDLTAATMLMCFA